MSRNELSKLKKAELKEMLKERNISIYKGKNVLTNAEMVEKILEHDIQVAEQPVEKPERKQRPKKKTAYHASNPLITDDMAKKIVSEINASDECTPWVMGNKDAIINETEPGTLVAFLDDKGKPRTAKLIHRSSAKRKLQLVTEYNWEFIVSYDNVLWVRRGTRWPKAVYLMLKGYKDGKHVSVTYQK